MADLSQFLDDVDDRAIAPSTGVPEPVPPGEYLLHVERTELVTTKDGTGILLKVTLAVASGPFEGRKLFPQFNVRNRSAQAQAIGIAEFKALCLACGVDYEVARRDTDALLFKPFRAMVGFAKEQVNPATGQPYPPRNEVKRYIPAGSAAPPPAPAAPAAVAAPAAPPAAARGDLPWKRPAA